MLQFDYIDDKDDSSEKKIFGSIQTRTTNNEYPFVQVSGKKIYTWLIALDHISKVLVVLNKHVNM